MSRVTFQNGSLQRIPTVDGHRWVLRYNKEGKRKALTIGDHKSLPTEAEAKAKAADIIPTLNSREQVYTFGQVIERYELEELGKLSKLDKTSAMATSLRNQTVSSYSSKIKHIKPKWGYMSMVELLKDLMAIKIWLRDLQTFPTKDRIARGKFIKGRPARPMSKKSKLSIKALMHRLINCAMLWGYMPVGENPIALIEVKMPMGVKIVKRLKVPLTPQQLTKLVADPLLAEHVRVMIKVSVGLGVRISEVLGLTWQAFDWDRGVVMIECSAVGKHIGDTKSDASRSEMPVHPYIQNVLLQWKASTPVVGDWVFGNILTKRPFHRDSLQADHLLPAGERCGISNLGWHTFRHTHSKQLRIAGVPIDVQMMSLRHADIATSMEYGQDDGSMDLKRNANDLVIASLFPTEIK